VSANYPRHKSQPILSAPLFLLFIKKIKYLLTDESAEPARDEGRSELDEREREIGQQETTHVTHETLSVQVPQLGQKGVDDQGDGHEHRGEKHPDGVHGEHQRRLQLFLLLLREAN